jgi:sodium/hydrogen antiporter
VTILAVAVAGQALAGLSLAAAVLIGAVLAPTDPVLAGDLQVGPPGRGKEHPVRLTLTTEAGMNDWLAFPFVHLAILLAIHGGPSHALLTEWLARDVVWRIAIGIAGGLVAGTMLGRIVFRIPHANPLAKSGVGVIALAAVFLCYGATELVEGYGFIAVFVAGLALRRTEPEHRYHHTLHAFVEPVEYAVTAAMLFLLGGAIVIVVPAFSAPVIGIAILLIFVIRPAAAWLSMLGTPIRGMARWDAAFFGVRGVGSIYYIAFASTHAAFERLDTLWAIVAATIFLSTIVHGLSAGFVARRYDDA